MTIDRVNALFAQVERAVGALEIVRNMVSRPGAPQSPAASSEPSGNPARAEAWSVPPPGSHHRPAGPPAAFSLAGLREPSTPVRENPAADPSMRDRGGAREVAAGMNRKPLWTRLPAKDAAVIPNAGKPPEAETVSRRQAASDLSAALALLPAEAAKEHGTKPAEGHAAFRPGSPSGAERGLAMDGNPPPVSRSGERLEKRSPDAGARPQNPQANVSAREGTAEATFRDPSRPMLLSRPIPDAAMTRVDVPAGVASRADTAAIAARADAPAAGGPFQADRASIMAAFIVNAAAIPGWPPPRPYSAFFPVAAQACMAGGPGEKGALAQLQRMGAPRSALARLLKGLRRLRRRREVAAALALLLGAVEEVMDCLIQELVELGETSSERAEYGRTKLLLR